MREEDSGFSTGVAVDPRPQLLVDLQNKFIQADTLGVIAVATTYIHLRGELFVDLCRDKPVKASWNGRKVELESEVMGRKVMVLTEVI